MEEKDSTKYDSFKDIRFNVKNWKTVSIPHNWDDYYGYRRITHGNLHGYAWYRLNFEVKNPNNKKRYFLRFEGVSSYATIWVNGKYIGKHSGGRTSFSLDVSDAINYNGKENIVAVKVAHPAMIRDLPWVCGGCSDERGFSEGSQPMGIFRPVHLEITDPIRIEPFGIHVWNQENKLGSRAEILSTAEIHNYGNNPQKIEVIHQLIDQNKKIVATTKQSKNLSPKENAIVNFDPIVLKEFHLWSLENPYLYQLKTEVFSDGKLVDVVHTDYGIRYVSWPVNNKGSKQFLLNGKPVFINGIAEYEHILGGSHAFTKEEIKSRVEQIKAAGFNAFRDAHQPHNLEYQYYWNHDGMLWWPQFSAHIWFDSPEFKENFKSLLRDWIKERRNDPSVVTWGLQNESRLPKEFAEECMSIIHEMDPTSVNQRMINTCNGGEGTDWDVPQNWSGTYGGDPNQYGEELKKELLVGEYGAWRSIDLHKSSELSQNRKYNEEDMTDLIELKLQKAESVKDSVCGHFFWLYNSHDNPGRVQGGEGMREIDRIGPVNYKGLLTSWGEPLDVYYMFRSNYANAKSDPMVYIASHNWPDRFEKAQNAIIKVYSNCDEVELFNDTKTVSFGKKKNLGIKGTHFEWDNVFVQYNVLYAKGYVNGKVVCEDVVLLHYLPNSPNYKDLQSKDEIITKKSKNLNYIYRVNCGGDQYVDHNGNKWLADINYSIENKWGSTSWAENFKELNPVFASQREISDPIKGTVDWPLFQTYRYGKQELEYHFPLLDGSYTVELYFVEPWFGKGGNNNASGWRLFDVAANDIVIEKNLDIWKEVGFAKALKKTYIVNVKGGLLRLNFPNIEAGQAVISAIGIASANNVKPQTNNTNYLKLKKPKDSSSFTIRNWLSTNTKPILKGSTIISGLPYYLYGAEWLQTKNALKNIPIQVELKDSADVYVAVDSTVKLLPKNLIGFEKLNEVIHFGPNDKKPTIVYRKRFPKGEFLSFDSEDDIFICAQPVTNILPAYDLKAVTTYKATDALFSSGNWKEISFNKKNVLQLQYSGNDTLVFNFHTGVADIYSLTLKYSNMTDKKLPGKLILENASNTVLKVEEITLDLTKEGKWGLIETNSDSMINAGDYKFKLVTNDAKGLVVSGIEIR
ncbi:MAG: glycoside hydrolase family 2 [Pseudopedobacter saltans]|uniref:Glycoside hydrolase family 2 n=1 Tax=Pseudopedobacter saltans TaxID=151895 RepID=A0A2W5GPL5_9SPHI|nr:MAG: glycoside hydrolase family 2 [Pseudopedobacter saltans]